MKTLSAPLLVALLVGNTRAQSIQWMRDAGATPFSANERGDAVDADADGNAYVLGHLSIDSQFSGSEVPAAQDGCLAKYDAVGTVQWVRTFGGPGFVDMQETAVKVASAENAVYVCGSFRTQFANPTITFDTIAFTFAGNSRHAFVAKYDLDGNIQWMRHGGGEGIGAGFNDLDIDAEGRILAVGTTDGATLFSGQNLNYAGGLLARYMPDGTLSDLVQLNDGDAEHQEATAVEVAPGSGNIYIGGAFFGTIGLNGASASSTAFSTFVLKLDPSLSGDWITAGGGNNATYGSYAHGLALDAAENVYITGEASGDTVTFGSHSFIGHTFYDDEVFVAKLSSDGIVQWLRHGGSEQNDEAFDIIADAQGNTLITGMLGGNTPFAEFDGIQVDIVSQSTHCFIARYDPDGQVVYAERMGGGSDDVGSGLTLANDSTFFLTGTTWGSTPWLNWNFQCCCLDPNLFIAKVSDIFNDLSTHIGEATNANGPDIALTPNPVSTTLWINGLPPDVTYQVFSANGSSMPCSPMGLSIEVSTWPAGLYSLRVANGAALQFVIRH